MKARLRWALVETAAWTTVAAFALVWSDVHTVVGFGGTR